MPGGEPADILRQRVLSGQDRLPRPGAGQTLQRWRVLAGIGREDLALAKLFEGHTDALAILAELPGPESPAGAIWGTWCAEPPSHRVSATPGSGQQAGRALVLDGVKAWCSGAADVTHALVTAWLPDGQPCLAAVAMDQPGVQVLAAGAPGVGMARSGTLQVGFKQAVAVQVGQAGDYTARPGFWQGGAGVAACWWGGCAGIAAKVKEAAGRRGANTHPYLHAHLGALDVLLSQSAALLRETAAGIDAAPQASCARQALRARLAVESTAEQVLAIAARALGPAPLCQDPGLARLMADLPVFVRQSHAERDQAALAGMLLEEADAWML